MAVKPFEYLNINPMKNAKIPKFNDMKRDKDDLKIISIEDYKRILNRFLVGSSFYVPLQIAFNTGMRAAEVCGLTWDCVDLINGVIHVTKIIIYKKGEWTFGTPKTQSSCRKIPISKTLLNILKNQRKQQLINKLRFGESYINSNFVCTREKGIPLTTNSLKYLSYVVNKKLGVNFNFHSLRHTHATMLLEENSNLKDIQCRLGHSKLETTTDIYSHITKIIEDDTMNKFETINSFFK